MKTKTPTIQYRIRIAVAFLVVLFCALWLPALTTPFWGDDYFFLSNARNARLIEQPWWAAFWPDVPFMFWRPLSQEAFWRLVESILGSDSRSAHLLNLGLLALASWAVGVLGVTLSRACDWQNPRGTGTIGGLIYGCLALHLLPTHWVSAANSSILVIWTALCLAAWLAAPKSRPSTRAILWLAIPVMLLAALFSKESAVVLPLLMLALTVFVSPCAHPGRGEIAVWFACWVIIAIWFALRSHFTVNTEPQYALTFGFNLIRNSMSLVAWLFNIPREGIRMMISGQAIIAMFWMVAVMFPMVAVWTISYQPLSREINSSQALSAVAFVLFGYAPYFPLAWNSYAYYAAVAVILPTLLIARGLIASPLTLVGVALIGLSSLFAVVGTRLLDHPGLIGRANWADATLKTLEKKAVQTPLFVVPSDNQRFYAIGEMGLAWRLGINPRDVHVRKACPNDASSCLVIDPSGKWSLQSR